MEKGQNDGIIFNNSETAILSEAFEYQGFGQMGAIISEFPDTELSSTWVKVSLGQLSSFVRETNRQDAKDLLNSLKAALPEGRDSL